ncbi:MAG TPA: L,D-transpeptidase [Bacteroidia bacterium]|nr:L,D-transpeptidase [Bacteroidia bacterium]
MPDQRMAVYRDGVRIREYPISTSKFGLGDDKGSNRTPVGSFRIAKKIGKDAPAGTVFKSRKPTGEILPPDAPGRDPIVTRILWLKGLESQNSNAYKRYIYIHGTPEERTIGTPTSYGCVRMKSTDVMELFDIVGNGARVRIENEPLRRDEAPVR